MRTQNVVSVMPFMLLLQSKNLEIQVYRGGVDALSRRQHRFESGWGRQFFSRELAQIS
jgi:hypothetical protein